jgi:hypothetical protein
MFKHIDNEEYTLSQNGDYHLTLQGTPNVVIENSINKRTNDTPPQLQRTSSMVYHKSNKYISRRDASGGSHRSPKVLDQ